MSPVEPEKYEEHLARIEKQYGDIVFKGNEYDNPQRIPFSSPTMNWITDGGVPLGRFTRFYGNWSSSKSRMAWDVAASAQQMGLTVVYYNIEKQYHPEHAENSGVDIDDLKVVHSSRIEHCGATCETLLGSRHVHIIDSASAGVPLEALGSKVEDWQRGLKARVWNKVFDRLKDKLNEDNSIVYIDQVRVNQMTSALEPPGGKQMEHASDLTIEFKRSGWLFYNKNGVLQPKAEMRQGESLSGSLEPNGYQINVRVMKSRVCRPFRSALLYYDYKSGQYDDLFELIRAAKYFDMLGKSGTWLTLERNGGKPLRFQGDDKFRAYLEEDDELQDEIRSRILQQVA